MDNQKNAPKSNDEFRETAHTAEQHTAKMADALDAKLSGPLAPLESSLDEVFGSKSQFQLPENIKNFLVTIAPWLALLSGIFGLISAFNMWRFVAYLNSASNGISSMYGELGILTGGPGPGFTIMFWLAIFMMVLFSVLALLAFPGLRARKKVGWNLIFYSLLANIVYGLVSIFYYNTPSGLVGSAISAAIGFYILFQIRSHYVSSKN